jgi:hypothetical protein
MSSKIDHFFKKVKPTEVVATKISNDPETTDQKFEKQHSDNSDEESLDEPPKIFHYKKS